jgi:transcription elongation factor Elf1
MGEDIIPTVEVDINELNNAINTYNQIIDESSPVTLQALSQNQDFMEIGNALKELRAAVN